ncbi:MAG: cupin domain-containing protein [Kiritimatiellae bacterium]|nr:cupin domain-containing protein [Kiritimatiellia bacterium]
MKSLFTAMCAVLMIGLNVKGGEHMNNILKDIPYADSHMGKRQLVDEKHLLVMQVALKPGQQVPQHNANSNVHLLIVEGQIIVTLDGKDTVATKGDILPVTFKTLMSVRNASKENASFLIIKSPNPSEMTP